MPNFKDKLNNIETDKKVKILFAVESGSRLWRMESNDSDYDIRFVYCRQVRDYLSLHSPRDVIEKTQGDYDMVGFDIYKFSKLLLSSNPSIIEWLHSDIIYFDDTLTLDFFRSLSDRNYNPKALYHHYRSMCKKNYIGYLKSEKKLTYKKYLYSMRGLINALWVEQFGTIPPLDINETLCKVDMDEDVRSKLREVIEIKKQGLEGDYISHIHEFEKYIEDFLKKEEDIPVRKFKEKELLEEFIYNFLEV